MVINKYRGWIVVLYNPLYFLYKTEPETPYIYEWISIILGSSLVLMNAITQVFWLSFLDRVVWLMSVVNALGRV